MIKLGLDIVTCISAFLAALFWLRSATAKISYEEAEKQRVEESEQNDGWIDGGITINGADLSQSMALQTKWNKLAALSACVSAFSQAINTGMAMLYG